MKGPKVSVVVPVYNIAPYLERAVKSIQEQAYTNIEILLVDNGSTDGSTELVDALAETDSRIVPLHVEKKGVSFARLEGVRAASGEWIGFVDGDDCIEPDMYERLLNNALQYDAQISHCGYQMVFPSRVDYYYNTGRLEQQDNMTGLKDLLEGSFIEPGLWNKLFHKTLFHNLLQPDGFDLSIKINEDLLMNYFLFKESDKSVYEDFCPYHYLVRKNSTATSDLDANKIKDIIRVREMIKEDCRDAVLIQAIDKELLLWYVRVAALDHRESNCEIRKYARQRIKENRRMYLKGDFTPKERLFVIWVSIWPDSYRWIHALYNRASGLDKKYEVS